MNQNNNHSRGTNAAQQSSGGGKWALNVQDIIKRTHQNMQKDQKLNTDSSDQMSHQKSTNSQFDGNIKQLRTMQQDAYDPPQRAKSKEKMSAEKLNTISHTQVRKQSQSRKPQTTVAAVKSSHVFPKSDVEIQKSRQSSQVRVGMTSEPQVNSFAQGQGQTSKSSAVMMPKGQQANARGTTPLRMGRQNTAKAGTSTGLLPQKVSSSVQMNQRKNTKQATKSSNNQQIKGIMAAALASVKQNQQHVSVLPQGVSKKGDSNREQFLNFEADSNDLKILKANSVNQKYMTELIQNQKMMPEDMRAPAAARDLGSEYINTDEEDDEEEQAVPIHKQHSSPLRQSTYNRPPKSEERKVFSQQDYNELHEAREDFAQFPMGKVTQDRGRSSQAQYRPQSSYLPKHYSVERANTYLPTQNNTEQKQAKKLNTISPKHFTYDQQEVLTQMQGQIAKFETQNNQMSQRLDIFEEEIIKRVREIQKYSKGLNSLIKKSVMPDLQVLQERILEKGPNERVSIMEDQIIQIHQQLEMQKVILKNTQLNIGTDINTRFGVLQEQIEGIRVPQAPSNANIEGIQHKLVEQNQLISMLDEQLNSQEHQIQQIHHSISLEIEKQVKNIQLNQSTVVKPSDDFQSLLNEFEESLTIQLQEKISELETNIQTKMQEFEVTLAKQQEDSEGRDGLILQQNQDITNLYQANEQILENEKSFKVQFENLEASLNEFFTQEQVEQLVSQIQVNQDFDPIIKKFDSQLEGLRHNMEGRLQICIKQLKEEYSGGTSKNQEDLAYSIDRVRQYAENLEPKISTLQQSTHNLREALESLEHQFQAQFDEQSSQLEITLKKYDERIKQVPNQEQIEIILEKIDQMETQDVFAIFQKNKDHIEELQIEISQKCLEISQHQDNQVNSLIIEIKEIQENFVQLQEVVVQTNQDLEGVKTMEETLAQARIDMEKFRGHFEGINAKVQGEVFELQSAIKDLENETIQSLKELEARIQTTRVVTEQPQVSQQLEVKFQTQIDQLLEASQRDIKRLERQNEEIEIQLKNIYVENSKQFSEINASQLKKIEEIKAQFKIEIDGARDQYASDMDDLRIYITQELDPQQLEELKSKMVLASDLEGFVKVSELEDLRTTMARTSQVDRFEDVAADVRSDLQAQIEEIRASMVRTSQIDELRTQMVRTSQVDRFEDVAGRSSDVRRELEVQIEEIRASLKDVVRTSQIDELRIQFAKTSKADDETSEIKQEIGVLAAQIESLDQRFKLFVDQTVVGMFKEVRNDFEDKIEEILQLQKVFEEFQIKATKNTSQVDELAVQISRFEQQIQEVSYNLEQFEQNNGKKLEAIEKTFEEFDNQIDKRFAELSQGQSESTTTTATSSEDVIKLKQSLSDIQKQLNLDQKTYNSKFDVFTMDLKAFKTEQKTANTKFDERIQDLSRIYQTFSKQMQDILVKLDQQSSQDDIITLKHLVNQIQDSNFQAQIDELKRRLDDAKMRFSMPMPRSENVVEEFHSSGKKQPKKQADMAVAKVPKNLDLSPIPAQKQEEKQKFQETDDELQGKLKNLFPQESEKQKVFDQAYDDELDEYEQDDFEDVPSIKDHEKLYEQEVQLPILQNEKSTPEPPIDSFQNSSKVEPEPKEDEATEQQEVSINSINLEMTSEEQKEQMADKLTEQLILQSIEEAVLFIIENKH